MQINDQLSSYLQPLSVTVEELRSSVRKREIVNARIIISHDLRMKHNKTLMGIATILNKDHASIIYYLEKYEHLMEFDRDFRELVSNIKF